MPHRDYWLAPERRRASLAVMTSNLSWLGCGTMAFVVATMHLAFLINLGRRPGLGGAFWWLIGLYVLAILFSVVRMSRRFKKLPEEVR